jgi:hypothetical protein
MSTRTSAIYAEIDEDHSFHIYKEMIDDKFYLVDDFDRNPVVLSDECAKEIITKWVLIRSKQKENKNG